MTQVKTERDRLAAMNAVLWLTIIVAILLVFSYRAQVVAFKKTVHQDCVGRAAYDKSAQHSREQFRAYYQQNITAEQGNKFIDDNLRAQRIAADRRLIAALNDTLGKTVKGRCDRYGP